MVGRRFLFLLTAVTMAVFLSSGISQAQPAQPESEYQAYNLGDVVVSAEETRVKDITITNVITAEDIKATNSHTVAEALSHAPGVRVTTGAKNQATVSINGFSQDKVLFMIDGVPYYETYFNILDLGSINTDNIARIEIIKGAPSVLYGANAMGGAINIITKKGTEKPFTSASFELSENDTYRVSATHGMKKGIFNYWLSYMYEESDGWKLSNDFESKAGYLYYNNKPPVTNQVFENGGDRDNSYYEAQSIWAKFGIEPNEDSAYYVNFHYREREKGVPSNTVANNVFSRPVFSQFYADRMPEYDEWGIDLDGKQRLTEKLIAKLKLFYHDHEDSLYSYKDPTFNEILSKSHYKDWMAGGTFMLDYQPVTWNAIRLAVNYKGDSHKDVADEYLPYDKYFSYTGSVGLENEFTRIKNLSVVLGVSYDWFEVTEAKKHRTNNAGDLVGTYDEYKPDDDQINPMIGATYTFSDNTRVYASIARKSHFPTLKNLYSAVGDGDPHLKSEKSINYTVGASRPFGTFFKGDIGLFYYDIEDKISSIKKKYVNLGEVEMKGCEVGLEFYPMNDLILRADYTYNHVDAEKTASNSTSKVYGVAKHVLNLSGQYTVPVVGTRIDVNGSYMGSVYDSNAYRFASDSEVELDNYFLWNAKLTQEFGKHFEVYVAANNIFDEDYEWNDGYPGQGRNFWTGVTVKF